jgi:hypothetical protein
MRKIRVSESNWRRKLTRTRSSDAKLDRGSDDPCQSDSKHEALFFQSALLAREEHGMRRGEKGNTKNAVVCIPKTPGQDKGDQNNNGCGCKASDNDC